MSIYHKEQFGPVLPAVKFDDIQTPIERIRKINFGQQVSIYSTNPHEIMNVFNAVSTQQ
ncbi:aldehyde dehydrogenase family protein [Patescibacteria group bacterium]|nr:aldehyde dehydrogenase family protein [Patescibacteria group bacterium]